MDNTVTLWLVFLTIVLPGIGFAYYLLKKPTSLWTGFYFTIILTSGGISLILFLEQINTTLAFILAIPLGILLLLVLLFGIYAMIIALFWNERVLLKYERPSLANFLPLIVATGLLFLQILFFLAPRYLENHWLLALFSYVNTLALYFMGIFIMFTLTAFLYNKVPIRGKIDYIIILGAGLNKDKVTPLLSSRIEAGIKLYHRLEEKQQQPTIIVSGGQGPDELISEGEAMAAYIHTHHPDVTRVLIENESTNTQQNITLSEKVAQKADGIGSFKSNKIVIATNNYHLLRAGKLAVYQGINAQGVGAKTRWFYLPTAFIREYIGYLVMTKGTHIKVSATLFILFFLLNFLTWMF